MIGVLLLKTEMGIVMAPITEGRKLVIPFMPLLKRPYSAMLKSGSSEGLYSSPFVYKIMHFWHRIGLLTYAYYLKFYRNSSFFDYCSFSCAFWN
jgi:hypothetical protein